MTTLGLLCTLTLSFVRGGIIFFEKKKNNFKKKGGQTIIQPKNAMPHRHEKHIADTKHQLKKNKK
jgi:hypothetical protein